MAIPGRGRPVRIIFATIVLALAGCGDGKKAMVTGKVTYEGQAVESGFITFFPEDKQGTSVEGEIINGEYTIVNLTPGKKRVFISITEQVEPTTTNITKSREEANTERLAKRKKKAPSSKQSLPGNFSGNNKIVDIVLGSQQVDIPLGKPRAGK
jgi:hypothetical protein